MIAIKFSTIETESVEWHYGTDIETKGADQYDGIKNNYFFYVTDIFNRVWKYTGNYNANKHKDGKFESYEDAQKLEIKVKNKGYIEPEYYWIYSGDDEFYGARFNSIEKVVYVSSSEDAQYTDSCWRLFATTAGGFYYEHEKKFKDYEELVKLAIKVKKKGIVNLKYWECREKDDSENWQTNIKELQKEEYNYYEDYCDPEEVENQRILDQIEADSINGVVPGFR